MRSTIVLLVIGSLLLGASEVATRQVDGAAAFRTRRERAIDGAPGSLLLVPARPQPMAEGEFAFRQDPSFLYLTGLANAVGALLVLDTPRRESWLFVPGPGELAGFAALMHAPSAYVPVGADSARELGLDHVVAWSEFGPFVDRRLADEAGVVLRGPFAADAAPAGAPELVGQSHARLWERSLRERFPRARFGPSPNAAALRSLKTAGEIAVIRRVASASSQALRAALTGIRPERRQREVETEVAAACVRAGAEQVSFWPWIMSGPNANFEQAVQSLADAGFGDRQMRAGELARLDVGCTQERYSGDVGRTAPVSGRFDDAQREAWDLFVAAYRAALPALRPGATSAAVFTAWQAEIRRREPGLRTPLGRRTAQIALAPKGAPCTGSCTASASPVPKVWSRPWKRARCWRSSRCSRWRALACISRT